MNLTGQDGIQTQSKAVYKNFVKIQTGLWQNGYSKTLTMYDYAYNSMPPMCDSDNQHNTLDSVPITFFGNDYCYLLRVGSAFNGMLKGLQNIFADIK